MLSKEEKVLLLSLMQKMLEEDTEIDTEEVVEKPKKRGRQKVENTELKKKRGRPKKTTVVKDKDIEEVQKYYEANKIEEKPKGPVKKNASSKQMGLKKAPVIKPIDTSPNTANRFLEMISGNAAKNDTKIDRLLIGNNQRSPRIRTQATLNDVKCSRCNNYYDNVLAILTWSEENESVFVCEECNSR